MGVSFRGAPKGANPESGYTEMPIVNLDSGSRPLNGLGRNDEVKE